MFSTHFLYSGQLSQSGLTQGPCRMHCICIVHQVSQLLYIHMYFNTVPQIVEEQHCFQTLWNLKIHCCHKRHCKDQQLKTCFVQRIVSSKSVQKGSCIVNHCDTMTRKQSSLSARCAVLWLSCALWSALQIVSSIVTSMNFIVGIVLSIANFSLLCSFHLVISIIVILIVFIFVFIILALIVNDPLLVVFVSTL